MDSLTSSSTAIACSMSFFSPAAMVDGLWIISIPTGLMSVVSPAIATTDAADAAMPWIFTVTFPG